MRRFQPLSASYLDQINPLMRRSKGHWERGETYLDQFMGQFALTAELIAGGIGSLLLEEDRVVGFYLFSPEDGQWWLDYFFVDSTEIGKGYGAILWDHAIEAAKQAEIADFKIWSDTGAEGFYHRMGASTIDRKLSPATGILAPVCTYQVSGS